MQIFYAGAGSLNIAKRITYAYKEASDLIPCNSSQQVLECLADQRESNRKIGVIPAQDNPEYPYIMELEGFNVISGYIVRSRS